MYLSAYRAHRRRVLNFAPAEAHKKWHTMSQNPAARVTG